jgi:hypothetical protein
LRPKNVRASYIIVATACLALTEIAAAQAPAGSNRGTAPKPATAVPAGSAPSATPGAPAATPPPAAPPTQAQRDTARAAYARGQGLFAQGKYEEAQAAFQEAYDVVPNAVVLISLAECSVRLGKLDDAEALLQRYLSDRPDAPDRDTVETKIAELRSTPSMIVLSTTPAGAQVALDGSDTGKLTPVELTVTPGTHKVEVKLDGYLPIAENLEIKIGGRHELQIELQKAPPPPPPPPPPPVAKITPPPPVRKDTDPTAALWVTSIVGAAGLVTGTVLGFMVLAERSDYDAMPTEKTADRGERLALFADVSFGVGAMALITGAVLYLTDDSASEPAPAATPAASAKLREPSFAVAPVAGPRIAGLTARVRY